MDISTAELSLVAARLGGIGHISDAMVPTVSDRRFNTKYVKTKLKQYKFNDQGKMSAIVVMLLLAVLPIMIYQVRHFRAEEAAA